MAFELGTVTDQSDANSLADPVVAVQAAAVKLPANYGAFWNAMGDMIDPTSNREFVIYSRTDTQRSGTVDGAGWTDAVTLVGLPVTSTSGLIKGLVLNVDGEYVVIDNVASATTIDVVARGAAGTTAAAHIATTAYTVEGSAINDVDLKDIGSVSEITNKYPNFMQTVAEPIDFTKGGEIDPRKGLSASMLNLLQEEAMTRVAKNVMRSAITGKKQDKSGSSPYMTAGLIQQLTDTSSGRLTLEFAVNGALTETALKGALKEVSKTGMPTHIVVSGDNKELMNDWLIASSNAINVNTDLRNTVAGAYVDAYNYEGNIIQILVDQSMPNTDIAIINIAKCKKGWKAMDALEYHDEGTVSSREKRASFNGSYGMAIEDVGYEHIIMTGITT